MPRKTKAQLAEEARLAGLPENAVVPGSVPAVASADKDAPKGGVVVEFEDGERTYTGKDAKSKAAEFVSKRPNERRIVK